MFCMLCKRLDDFILAADVLYLLQPSRAIAIQQEDSSMAKKALKKGKKLAGTKTLGGDKLVYKV